MTPTQDFKRFKFKNAVIEIKLFWFDFGSYSSKCKPDAYQIYTYYSKGKPAMIGSLITYALRGNELKKVIAEHITDHKHKLRKFVNENRE